MVRIAHKFSAMQRHEMLIRGIGTIVHGTITSVSPQMNTALRNVKMTPKGQDPISLDTVHQDSEDLATEQTLTRCR